MFTGDKKTPHSLQQGPRPFSLFFLLDASLESLGIRAGFKHLTRKDRRGKGSWTQEAALGPNAGNYLMDYCHRFLGNTLVDKKCV
jgi:hypothetical protein